MATRHQIARLALILTTLVAATVGALLVHRYPPRNPLDYWPVLATATLGASITGLLLGLLASLYIRNRITSTLACSAVLIPASAFGWFVNGKTGNWDTARIFAIVGIVAMLVFSIRSIDLISKRPDTKA